MVLGSLGLAVGGAAVYAWLWADDAVDRAQRSSRADERQSLEGDAEIARAAAYGGIAAGGALFVTGVLLGIFRNVSRPTYESQMNAQIESAREKKGDGDLAGLIASLGTWTVKDPSSNGG